MARFAEKTSVSSDKSRAEIERVLTRYGASGFMYGWQAANAVIAFEMQGRRVKFTLPLPERDNVRFTRTPTRNTRRRPEQVAEAYEQEVRQRWRALALVIKAKLEAVETGITVFEEEFLAHIVLPNGNTVGHWMVPQLAQAYTARKMPPMLPGA
jgi:hypothetical protein